MKNKSKISAHAQTENLGPKREETPKYFLADVPRDLRLRALDLCIRRLWHQALELLHTRGFDQYTQDDLVNFYHWAPKELPSQPALPEPPPRLPRDYTQPPAEQIAGIRERLNALAPDVTERVHHALHHEPLEHAASLLWKAGAGVTSSELYEYRKTLFPPNAMVDPYTAGPPLLRPNFADRGCGEALPQRASCASSVDVDAARVPDQSVIPVSPSGPEPTATDDEPLTPDNGSMTTDDCGVILLSDLRNLIRRYVILPEMAAETLALWVVHTYAFTLRDVTTYIGVVSPEKRCGKTTLLELLGLLAHEAITAANISPSALFRVIEERQPTLFIDEADTFLQGRDEMAGILNAGYRKTNSYVVRVSQNKSRGKRASAPLTPDHGPLTNANPSIPSGTESQITEYSCWCPKVMAAIGRLPDTLADRCIVITMQRKTPGEQCERMRHLNAARFRQRCEDFVREHSRAIATAQPEIPAILNDRAADIWEPLFAIADLAGGDWPALAREAAEKLSGSHDDEVTLVGYFLKDIRTLIYNRDADRILSRDIIAVLNPRHDRPWEDIRRGREINEYWLGRKMRELGIRSKVMRVENGIGKGYTLADVTAAYRRYVPNVEGQAAEGDGRGRDG